MRDGPGSAGSWIAGNQNVQIQDVSGSTIQITYGGQRRRVPLEPAVISVGNNVGAPAQLVRARSGIVPYTARAGLLADVQAWLGRGDAFAACLVGGRGGSGKTRLGVELCEQVRESGWLRGLLTLSADQAALEALADTPTARLVVVDYAETRGEQLEVVLPLLASAGTEDHPVRVVLLVRSAPRDDSDWTALLRHRSHALDAVLNDTQQWILDDRPLDAAERVALFDAAATALTARADPALTLPDAPGALSERVFASPLMVVIAGYLAVHGSSKLPTSKADLLEELLHHERRYWKHSATAHGIDHDPDLAQRIIALATLAGADSEFEAAGLLKLIPDLADASAKERRRLARWIHGLYPGSAWWNPLEPDLIGEHLVATTLTDMPPVLTGVLTRDAPYAVVQPLNLYAVKARRNSPLVLMGIPHLVAWGTSWFGLMDRSRWRSPGPQNA